MRHPSGLFGLSIVNTDLELMKEIVIYFCNFSDL